MFRRSRSYPCQGADLRPPAPLLADVPGVSQVFPVVSRSMMGRVHGKRFRGVLLGLPVEQKTAWSRITAHRGASLPDPDEAILAAETAKSLGAVPGDRLIILARRGPRTMTIVGLARSAALGEYARARLWRCPWRPSKSSSISMATSIDCGYSSIRMHNDRTC